MHNIFILPVKWTLNKYSRTLYSLSNSLSSPLGHIRNGKLLFWTLFSFVIIAGNVYFIKFLILTSLFKFI